MRSRRTLGRVRVLLTIGRRLGSYDVVALLGAGGMGEVYHAHDSRLQRDVALKVLQIDNPEGRQRFRREALAIAALNHPNIITIYSVEEVEGLPFLTMELVDGVPLNTIIPPTGLPLARLLPIAIPIAEALAAAHRKGIVHRDLKPANVMVTSEGRVKVLDFGLAKTLEDEAERGASQTDTYAATGYGVTLGTVAYMSPEQARGEAVDVRSDIFSLGVVLFEMAGGRRPFQGGTTAVILTRILEGDVPPLGAAFGELDRVLARALAKKPSDRYQSADDLLSDLRAMTTGEAVSAPSIRKAGPSIAVLPFVNMSGDPDQEYFCDGMAEELISALGRVKGLSVVARTSAFQFKGQTIDVRQIGERLKVRTVLEGSVRRMGNRLRVSAQLITVDDGYQIWSERYDRTIDDVFAIQDEIARAITEGLKVALAGPSGAPIVKQGTTNLEAYQCYLRGRFLMNFQKSLMDSFFAARKAFEQAIALDPEYAAAHAGLSECYNALGYTGFLPSAEASRGALAHARRALELDPDLAEAHTQQGWTKATFSIDLATAEPDFQRALALSPDFAPAHGYYANLLTALGRPDEALAQADRARQLDPLWVIMPFIVSLALICARRFEEAERQMRDLMDLDSRLEGTYWFLSSALAGQGRIDEAITVLEKGVPLVFRAPFFLALLGLWYARAGRRGDAEAVLAELLAGGFCPPVWLAILCGGLGHIDRAFGYLEQAIEQHNDQVCFMGVDHRFDELRHDPRFPVLMTRIGLPLALIPSA